MKRLFVAALLGGTALASPANATLQIAATINGSNYFCADEQACDTSSGTVGVLTTGNVTIGGVTFNGSEQIQVIGPQNILTTTSNSITNNTGAAVTYQVAIGATDYTGPVTTYTAAGSGTWLNTNGSTVQMVYYADPANTQGADSSGDLPGTQLADSGLIPGAAGNVVDAYDYTNTGAFSDADLFSMTMGVSGTIANGTTLIGRSQDITLEQVAVPEPASLALLGGSLVGMAGFLGWRRRHPRVMRA